VLVETKKRLYSHGETVFVKPTKASVPDNIVEYEPKCEHGDVESTRNYLDYLPGIYCHDCNTFFKQSDETVSDTLLMED